MLARGHSLQYYTAYNVLYKFCHSAFYTLNHPQAALEAATHSLSILSGGILKACPEQCRRAEGFGDGFLSSQKHITRQLFY
jgi:hypothetical protein